jgi:hypothetical protein
MTTVIKSRPIAVKACQEILVPFGAEVICVTAKVPEAPVVWTRERKSDKKTKLYPLKVFMLEDGQEADHVMHERFVGSVIVAYLTMLVFTERYPAAGGRTWYAKVEPE